MRRVESKVEMDRSLLDLESDDTEHLLNQLLMDSQRTGGGAVGTGQESRMSGGIPYIPIIPKEGFCVKLKYKNDEKVFINVCHSDMVPPTKNITEDELLTVLESDDPSQFRIPMSIGEPHAEVDKSGGGCAVYDVIVHTDFINKLKSSELFQTFFLTVVCEGIEEKFKTELKREWVVLKNRRCVGRLQEQNVRTKSKPLIMDLDDGSGISSKKNLPSLIEEMESSPRRDTGKKQAPEPKVSIVKEPAVGHPQFLVAEIHLPQVKTAQALTLDMGEDRILLETRSNVYHLDIYLPYNIIQEDVGAQFDRRTKNLTVTMPVQPES